MKDKKPLVLQEEYGKDEDGTQVNIVNVVTRCQYGLSVNLSGTFVRVQTHKSIDGM